MTLDKFTIKAQEAVQQAVNTAQLSGQQVIEPVHILKGVMEKAKDVVNFIFQKLGVNAQQIDLLVSQEIQRAGSHISLTKVIMYSCAHKRPPRRWVTSLSAWNRSCWRCCK